MSDSSILPSSTEPNRQSGLPTPIEPPRREAADRKPIFHVPHDPVRHYVGRDELLEELRKELSSGRRAALTQAITGLGGIGKTQLAVQYAHRFFADYDVVWWLNAESEMILRAELAALAVPLELPEKDQSDQDRVRLAVLGWLATHDRWLLIFDNAEQPEDLRGCLPHEAGGDVIITSRNPNWLAVATPLALPVLKPSPSAELLQEHIARWYRYSLIAAVARRLSHWCVE
jgi:hypothetical protein